VQPPDSRLAELAAALSLACDLGNDFPLEKGLRNTVLAMRLGRALGLSDEARSNLYYVSLLRFIGCSAYSHEVAQTFSDDNAMRGAMAQVDFAFPAEALRQASSLGRGALGRAGAAVKMITRGKSIGDGLIRADCETLLRGAERLGMPPGVAHGLADIYERWDGKGGPRRSRGEVIDVSARVLAVAHQAEIHHRLGGREGARRAIKRGSGGWFDPLMAKTFVANADALLGLVEGASSWDLVLEEEPLPQRRLGEGDLEAFATTFGDFADLKSVWLLGHSRAVAQLAVDAAKLMQLPVENLAPLRLAGLLHDLGRLSVPTGLWDKPASLSPSEWERVRLHAHYTERVLSKSPLLTPVAAIAGLHHERLDGTGYHRGVPAANQPTSARVLAAADVYQALTEARPHRAAHAPEAAAAKLRELADAGSLDREAVRAVCQAAGHRMGKRSTQWPAGLSQREVEVLRHLARGKSEKEIAAALFISAGTVHTHVAHIYAKIGLSTRAGAALFAMEHHLLP
jgi:HD-GYP domain-containing protein (c-di-GMP phosphodiesterase class II)